MAKTLKEELMTPPAGLKESPTAPVHPKSKFRVKLPDNPVLEIEATDQHEAFKEYKKACRIIRTIHEPEITNVE
jgi:hypothetical protein